MHVNTSNYFCKTLPFFMGIFSWVNKTSASTFLPLSVTGKRDRMCDRDTEAEGGSRSTQWKYKPQVKVWSNSVSFRIPCSVLDSCITSA